MFYDVGGTRYLGLMNDPIDRPGDPLAGIDEAVAALRAAWAGER